jgi:hypothetical protein
LCLVVASVVDDAQPARSRPFNDETQHVASLPSKPFTGPPAAPAGAPDQFPGFLWAVPGAADSFPGLPEALAGALYAFPGATNAFTGANSASLVVPARIFAELACSSRLHF